MLRKDPSCSSQFDPVCCLGLLGYVASGRVLHEHHPALQRQEITVLVLVTFVT